MKTLIVLFGITTSLMINSGELLAQSQPDCTGSRGETCNVDCHPADGGTNLAIRCVTIANRTKYIGTTGTKIRIEGSEPCATRLEGLTHTEIEIWEIPGGVSAELPITHIIIPCNVDNGGTCDRVDIATCNTTGEPE